MLATVIITISRVPPRRDDDPRDVRATAEGTVLAETITFLRTALQRGRLSPRDYGYTRLPTLVLDPGGLRQSPTSRRSPACRRTIFATDMHVLPCAAVVIYTPLHLPSNLRLPIPVIRSVAAAASRTIEGAPGMPEVLLDARRDEGEM